MARRKNRDGEHQKPASRAGFSWKKLLLSILTIIVVSFLGGFIIGIKAHRDGVEIAQFVDQYITEEIGDGSAMLVFRCGENPRLAAYNLLTDQILTNKEAIQAAQKDRLLNFTQTELFASGTGIALGSLAATYSFRSEIALAAKGKVPIQRILFAAALAVPSAYAGYAISDNFRLECASDKLYEYLVDPKNWRPHQYQALKQLFLSMIPCVPRNVTLQNHFVKFPEMAKRWKALVTGAKSEDVPERQGGPSADEVAHIVMKVKDARYFELNQTTWGDSIFLRIQGFEGLTPADSQIDRVDFIGLLKQAKFCRERLAELGYEDELLESIAMGGGAYEPGEELRIELNGSAWLRLALISGKL